MSIRNNTTLHSDSDRNLLPLAATSAIVLGLEVFETRLLTYSVPMLFIYAVVGIALLGFGAAGSLVSTRLRWLAPEILPISQAWSALAFCASVVIAHATFGRLSPWMNVDNLASLVLASVLCLPFFAAGTLITLSLSATPATGKAYAANLIGSGLGCFLPIFALGPLTGQQLLAAMAVLAFVCAVWYVALVRSRSLQLQVATGVTFLLVSVSVAAPTWMFPIHPEPEPLGQLSWQYRYAAENGITVEKAYDRWNPTGRIEIIRLRNVPEGPEPYPAMFYVQDASAGSSLFGWDGRDITQVRASASDAGSFVSRLCTETQYGQGYYVRRPRVLVIGLGGAPDVQCALYHGAEAVDVVEINEDSIAAVRGKFNRWLGGVGSDPRVRYFHRDGRSYIRSTTERYDLIQMSGVDTKNLMASGALALSENHLYTREALGDFFDHLRPGGAISLMRFGEAEQVRLANTAISILRERGIGGGAHHVGLLNTGVLNGVIIRREPWNEADARALDSLLHPVPFRGARVYYYSLNAVPLDTPATVTWLPFVGVRDNPGRFMVEAAAGRAERFAENFASKITPATDDRPFFFDVYRYDLASTWSTYHVRALMTLLATMLALAVLLVLLPVLVRRKEFTGVRRAEISLFFACIGLAFILVEVWLFHRFTMYLGHQVYAVSVVLASLLVSTGVGALFGDRFATDPKRRARLGIAVAIGWLAICAFALTPLLDATWSLPLAVRATLTVLCVSPLGFALGQPFVGALDWLGQHDPASRPWCIGINGVASVFASVAVVTLSMALGYRGVLFFGVMLYVVAAIAIGRFPAPSSQLRTLDRKQAAE